jgi:putative SOS response-associated peptidase YedK
MTVSCRFQISKHQKDLYEIWYQHDATRRLLQTLNPTSKFPTFRNSNRGAQIFDLCIGALVPDWSDV